ncbi:MAG: EamA family transporter [Hyphomicrobiaceae bacterium]|nr:EamA family transporter [Hyphomicrobiaceae bacterium]
MPLRHILAALVVVAIWGFNFVVIKLSVNALPPILAAGIRFAFASWPLVFFIRPPKTEWYKVVLFGLTFGFALYSFLNFALSMGMPAGLASVVLQVQAFFTMLIAFFVLHERPRAQQIIGAIIAFAGIGVMAIDRFEGAQLWPFALTILAAISWGVANNVAKTFGGANPVATTVWGGLVASFSLIGLSLVLDGPQPLIDFVVAPDLYTVGVLAFLAYPATLFGMAIWNHLLALHPASIVAPFTLLVPITGLLSGYLVLGETIAPLEMAGGALIVLGIAISVFRRRRRSNTVPV